MLPVSVCTSFKPSTVEQMAHAYPTVLVEMQCCAPSDELASGTCATIQISPVLDFHFEPNNAWTIVHWIWVIIHRESTRPYIRIVILGRLAPSHSHCDTQATVVLPALYDFIPSFPPKLVQVKITAPPSSLNHRPSTDRPF